jgi:hypothetical protein
MNNPRNFTLPLIGGALLLLTGSCGILLSIALAFDVGKPSGAGGKPLEVSTVLFALFLGLIFAVPGALIVRSTRARQRREHQEAVERRVLQVAATQNYRITATDVAMQTDLSLGEAQNYLEQLARKGEIGVEVGENGVMVYNLRSQ